MRAYDIRPVVLLQRRGKELGRGVAVLVDQHRHGHVQAHAVGLGGRLVAVLVHADEDGARGQQIVQQRRQLADESAGVGAHVENKAQRPLVEQRLYRGYRGLRRAGLEVGYLDISYIAAEHLVGHGVRVDHGAVDRDVRLVAVAVLDVELHGLARVGLYDALRVANRHAGDVGAVNGEYDVAGFQTRVGRGAVLIHAGDLHSAGRGVLVYRHAQTHVLVGAVELVRLVLGGAHVIAPLVAQRVHHGREGSRGHGVLVDGADVVFVERVLYLQVLHGLVVVVL